MDAEKTQDDLNLTILHEVQGQGGRYVAHLAKSDYTGILEWEPRATSQKDDVRVATHTIVPSEIGGRGIAGKLVERLIADARQEGFRIVPQCSYVAAKFEKNPDWSDLRA